eukprot:9160979-Prorocentrum_lima.AAC.1
MATSLPGLLFDCGSPAPAVAKLDVGFLGRSAPPRPTPAAGAQTAVAWPSRAPLARLTVAEKGFCLRRWTLAP